MDLVPTSLFAGSSGVRQYWMNPSGQFTTMGEAPEWLLKTNSFMPPEDRHDAKWTAVGARAGAPPLRTLTFNADKPQEFVNLYKASPSRRTPNSSSPRSWSNPRNSAPAKVSISSASSPAPPHG